MRLIWLAPLAMMTLYGAYLGLREGRMTANLSETAVIERFAEHYASQIEGAQIRDCVARPGGGRVWLVVDCAPTPFDEGRHRRYFVGRDGRSIETPDGI